MENKTAVSKTSLTLKAKLHWDFYLLSSGAMLDFLSMLPCTIIRHGETERSWSRTMKRIELGKSFRDFMLSGKDLDNSVAL